LNAKSEGDYPEFISHEISLKVAEKLVKKNGLKFDIAYSTSQQSDEKHKLKKISLEGQQLWNVSKVSYL